MFLWSVFLEVFCYSERGGWSSWIRPQVAVSPWECGISHSGWLVGVDVLHLWGASCSCGIKCSLFILHGLVIQGCYHFSCLTQMKFQSPRWTEMHKPVIIMYWRKFPEQKKQVRTLNWPVFVCILLWALQATSVKYSTRPFIIPEINKYICTQVTLI